MSAPEPLVVRFNDFCKMIGCKATKGHALLNSGEVQSFLDGNARLVVVQSIKDYVERRRLEAAGAAALPKKPVASARRRAEQPTPLRARLDQLT